MPANGFRIPPVDFLALALENAESVGMVEASMDNTLHPSPAGRPAAPARALLRAAIGAWVLGSPFAACGQTDEIQVYTAEIADPGELTLTLHNNYTPQGLRTPAFPGALVPNRALNGVPEWAYGATDWLELGMYLPVYTWAPGGHAYTEGAKLRTLFVVPHADSRSFFYGLNFEYSRNAERWESSRYSGEMRPILGVRLGPVDLVVNPILDTNFNGLRKLDFAPEGRLAYNLSPKWALAAEDYADLGEIRRLQPLSQAQQSLFGVLDYKGTTEVEFGIGRGLNDASEKLVVKLMLTWSLYHR